ncbi:MAG: polyphenol oxidase family protein [Bacteroidota bacterium]
MKTVNYYSNLLKTNEVASFITTKNISEKEILEAEQCEWPIHFMDQVHGHHFEKVGLNDPAGSAGEADALVTERKKVLLRVRVADCLPVLIYLPGHAVAAIHSGRASTEGNIVGKVLQYFKNTYPIEKAPTVWLGPCICYDCYQIDRATDLHFDMRGRVADQIHEVYPEAVLLQHDSCTLEDPQWFSYRENKTKERMYAYVGMQ